jgi:hypothetical protein
MLTAVSVTALFFTVGCKKTTTNTTVVKDSIYYSSWTPLSMTLNVDANNDSIYSEDFNNSKITQSVVSTGAIIGFFGIINGSGDTTALNVAELSAFYNIEQQISVGDLNVSALVDLSYANGGFLYRYVIIPGNVLANTSLANLTKTQLQHMSFTDVQKALTAASSSTGSRLNDN